MPDGVGWAVSSNGPGRNGISRSKPKKGGSLTFATTAEEQGFNASSARFDNVGVMYARTVFDPLAIVTAKGTWAPYLAESITPSPDYTSWTITLRPTVLFHDGTPCDGAALLLNVETYRTAFLTGIALKPVVQTVRQTDELSVQVTLNQPLVSLPFYLAGGAGGQIAWVMAPSMIKAKTGGTDHPIGTGPFRFTSWDPQHTLHRRPVGEVLATGPPLPRQHHLQADHRLHQPVRRPRVRNRRPDGDRRAAEHRGLPGQEAVVVHR